MQSVMEAERASSSRRPTREVRRQPDGARRRDLRRPSPFDRRTSHCRCLETVVAHAFRVAPEALRGTSRGHAPIAFARQVAMYVAHVWFGWSLSEVGRRFGRDRTTVSHACHVVEDRREDPAIDRVILAIESATELWTGLLRELEGEA